MLGSPLREGWLVPPWINGLRTPIVQADDRLVGLYQVFHDCGKPLCREVDAEGRQHFPRHAEVSRQRFLECSDSSPEAHLIADLIGMDMDAHTLRSETLEEFATRPQAPVLLATALCELHSNSQMFGGRDSSGFRAKYKRLNRFGQLIIGAT